jgi:hypothetical protein
MEKVISLENHRYGIQRGSLVSVKKGETLRGDLIHWGNTTIERIAVITKFINGYAMLMSPFSYLPKGTVTEHKYNGFMFHYETDIHPKYGEEVP